jgi:hypothetical protein
MLVMLQAYHCPPNMLFRLDQKAGGVKNLLCLCLWVLNSLQDSQGCGGAQTTGSHHRQKDSILDLLYEAR